MSKILVVQPYRMLQHAFSAALFPEHQVQLTETIPEPDMIKDADVVIVDAAALRERDSLHASELLAVQGWKTPTIWIDAESPFQAPVRKTLLPFNQAIAKDALQRALAECLGAITVAKQPANPKASQVSAFVKANSEEQENQEADADKKVIELVDVVDEEAARGKSLARQKK